MIYPDPNTNLLHPRTMIPTLTNRLEPGEHLLVSAVFGSTYSEDNLEHWLTPPAVEQHLDRSITVRDLKSGAIYYRLKS